MSKCNSMTKPKEVCMIFIDTIQGYVQGNKYIGETRNGESVIVDLDQDGYIMAIEFAGGDKPCNKPAEAEWPKYDSEIKCPQCGNRTVRWLPSEVADDSKCVCDSCHTTYSVWDERIRARIKGG